MNSWLAIGKGFFCAALLSGCGMFDEQYKTIGVVVPEQFDKNPCVRPFWGMKCKRPVPDQVAFYMHGPAKYFGQLPDRQFYYQINMRLHMSKSGDVITSMSDKGSTEANNYIIGTPVANAKVSVSKGNLLSQKLDWYNRFPSSPHDYGEVVSDLPGFSKYDDRNCSASDVAESLKNAYADLSWGDKSHCRIRWNFYVPNNRDGILLSCFVRPKERGLGLGVCEIYTALKLGGQANYSFWSDHLLDGSWEVRDKKIVDFLNGFISETNPVH